MERPAIFFFHGLESGPHGRKYQALSEHFAVTSPDFQSLNFPERLALAEEVTRGLTDAVVVGSSFGGLVAAALYSLHPERFRGYLLLAPALHQDFAADIARAPDRGRAIVLHGTGDDIVPIAASREFCARFDLELVEVDDDHRLTASTDLIVELTRRLCA